MCIKNIKKPCRGLPEGMNPSSWPPLVSMCIKILRNHVEGYQLTTTALTLNRLFVIGCSELIGSLGSDWSTFENCSTWLAGFYCQWIWLDCLNGTWTRNRFLFIAPESTDHQADLLAHLNGTENTDRLFLGFSRHCYAIHLQILKENKIIWPLYSANVKAIVVGPHFTKAWKYRPKTTKKKPANIRYI